MTNGRRTPEEIVRAGVERANAVRDGVRAASEKIRTEIAIDQAAGASAEGAHPVQQSQS